MKRIISIFDIALLTVLLSVSLLSCGGGDGGNGSTPADNTPPTVTATSPAKDATGVAVDSAITAAFSEKMDAQTISISTFKLTTGGTEISGSVSYTGTAATFTPLSNLSYSTSYTATVTTGAKDIAGNALEADYIWSFDTNVSGFSSDPMDVIPTTQVEESTPERFSATIEIPGIAGNPIVVEGDTLRRWLYR